MRKIKRKAEGNGFLSKTIGAAWKAVKDFFYERSVDIHRLFTKNKPPKIRKNSKKGARIFYWTMFALPLLQFLIFYVIVNFNSVLLAFQETIPTKGDDGITRYISSFVGLKTLKRFLTVELKSKVFTVAIKNSLVYFLFSLVVVIPGGIILSYYIYKKYRGAELFRMFLFLPSVICSLVLVIFYQYIADQCIPYVVKLFTGKRPEGLLTNPDTAFGALVFFNFWFSFGPSTLIYLNAMTQIDPSVVEAAELDGAVGLQQFWRVVLPLIFPSITSYIIICIAQVAMNQLSVHAFFETSAINYRTQTIGYNLFVQVLGADAELNYPIAAAGGVFFTLIIAPITLLVRWLLEKFGPSVE